MSDVKDLELRLRRIEDQLELLRLEGAYAFHFDRGDGQGWGALFTEDGSYSRREIPGQVEPMSIQGRANLTAYCNASRVSCVHMLHLPHFTVDGDSATSRILVSYRGKQSDAHHRPTQTESIGCYDVSYRRTAEGWRIHRRVNTFYDRQVQTAYGFEPSIPDFNAPLPPQKG